jgi:3'-phosphoadenosine 5'-phosphosulfate (PAPS) 3'-phosphatase
VNEREYTAAVAAVGEAAELCAAAQGRLAEGQTLTKSDASPVTIADFAAQAVVAATLTERLGELVLVGEEAADNLAGGRVTDVTGAPLDFGHGRRLERNAGVVATNGWFHDEVVSAVRTVLSADLAAAGQG